MMNADDNRAFRGGEVEVQVPAFAHENVHLDIPVAVVRRSPIVLALASLHDLAKTLCRNPPSLEQVLGICILSSIMLVGRILERVDQATFRFFESHPSVSRHLHVAEHVPQECPPFGEPVACIPLALLLQ